MFHVFIHYFSSPCKESTKYLFWTKVWQDEGRYSLQRYSLLCRESFSWLPHKPSSFQLSCKWILVHQAAKMSIMSPYVLVVCKSKECSNSDEHSEVKLNSTCDCTVWGKKRAQGLRGLCLTIGPSSNLHLAAWCLWSPDAELRICLWNQLALTLPKMACLVLTRATMLKQRGEQVYP